MMVLFWVEWGRKEDYLSKAKIKQMVLREAKIVFYIKNLKYL